MPSEGHKRTGRPRTGRPRTVYGGDHVTVVLSPGMTRRLEEIAREVGGDPSRLSRSKLIRLGVRMLLDSPRDVLAAALAGPEVATVAYRERRPGDDVGDQVADVDRGATSAPSAPS